MKLGKRSRFKPRNIQDNLKEELRISDSALLITVKAGNVRVTPLKEIRWRWQVRGILEDALAIYNIQPALGQINALTMTIAANKKAEQEEKTK